MRNTTIAVLAVMALARGAIAQELIITGVVDGPLSGGLPKAVELYVVSNVADLSIFGVGGANNGGGSDGEEFTFPAVSASAGEYIYVASESPGFTTFFGFAPDYTSFAASINGDDAIELFKNGSVVDVFGDINVDGSGEPWEYLDGWAHRVSGTGPDGSTFVLANWTFSGPNALDGETTNGSAATPFPVGREPTLLINETDADTPGSDALEFVELYDGGWGNTPLDGLVVVFYNGNGDTSYNSFDLDGFSTDADGYFLLGNIGVTPTPSIIFSSNGLQNGADAAALYQGDGTDFPNGTAVTTTNLVDAIVYDTNDGDDAGLLVLLNAGQPQVNEGGAGDKDNHSNQRCPNGSGGARNTNTFAQFLPTPADENVCVAPAEQVFIHEVQGNGASSPLVGSTVAIEGIVVGDFQDTVGTNGDLNGFFVQEEDADADSDPLTSEGIFVFNGSSPSVDVEIGDLVSVEGAVSEFFGATQITSFTDIAVLSSGNPLPTPASLSLPLTSVDDLEPSEGMYVTLAGPLVITEYFNFDRFGEIVLSSERLLQPTAVVEPGVDANAAAAANALDQLTLDDGRTVSNPDPAIHPNGSEFNLSNLFRGGDRLQNVTGVLGYSFGLYRVQPTSGADHFNDNPRTMSPDAVGGSITVASYNVLNYFTTIDTGADVCGPLGDQGCRGADNADELARQRAKLVAAISAVDADVVGLIEIENDAGEAAVADLVDGINDAVGMGTYDYIPTGSIGDDAIRVALIYKPAAVTPVGSHAILDGGVDPRFDSTLNRPVLAQSFQDDSQGGIVTVAVAHLKSKGSPCDDVGDPDMGDGQGNCNVTRTNAAEAMVDWLASDPTGSGVDNYLAIGDMNAYDKEDPIDVFVAGGYTDLVRAFQGEDAYSYLFGGAIGYLDYALASDALDPDVTGTTVWHINADEPDLIDYDTSFKEPNQAAIYAPDAYRSSDHDPVIVGLDVCETTPPGFDELSVTPEELWPANHKLVDVEATVVASDNFDLNPTVTLISVTSNEPDNGKGDGNTTGDIVIVDDTNFMLRAERAGGGDGRVYTITYQVTDACGNTATDSVEVLVPKSKGK
jgi:predicted extracellular nuclease